jgi:cytochrome b561
MPAIAKVAPGQLQERGMTQSTSTSGRYDVVTIVFHWLTALLVLALFVSSLVWNSGPRGVGRESLQAIHISMGIGLAAVMLLRLVWRMFAGRRLGAVGSSVTGLLSRLMHWALYGLLALQVALGFILRWFQGEAFSFLGLFDVPQLLAPNRGLEHTVENFHNLAAWALICLAGGHALMALAHHYVFKDDVLKRMLIGARRTG